MGQPAGTDQIRRNQLGASDATVQQSVWNSHIGIDSAIACGIQGIDETVDGAELFITVVFKLLECEHISIQTDNRRYKLAELLVVRLDIPCPPFCWESSTSSIAIPEIQTIEPNQGE
mgnify:CR=1 FL=1